MKFLKVATIACLMVFLTTGCSASTESPDKLLQKPRYDEKHLALYKGIDQLLLDYSSLILPENSKEVGKINEVDLDGDGIDELVAFEKKENFNDNSNEVGFIVLSENKDKTYTDKGTHLQSGDIIEYANFYDLNKDGYKEIILIIKEGNKSNMYIYNFKDEEITDGYTLDPNWLPNKSDFTNIKIKIGYIDDVEGLDIFMLHQNPKTNEMYISLGYFDEYIKIVDYIKCENVKNLTDAYITLGNIDKNKKGIILDLPTAKESNYITQLVYIEDKKLKKAFNDSDKSISKAYYIPIKDIDDDKIIDIPIVNGSGHTYTSKSSADISWYRWNGKKDETSRLVFTTQIYYNYKYNYKFFIPNYLANKIDIQENYDGENILFKFSYYDTVDLETKNLFTIAAINKGTLDENKNIATKNGEILKETENYSFVLYLNDVKELDKLNITAEALRECFSLIY